MVVTAIAGALVVLVFALVMSRTRSRASAAGCSDVSGCEDTLPPSPAVGLPPLLGFGAAAPEVTVALFVDLGSAASRQVFQQVTRAVGGGGLGMPAELRLLQLPADDCANARSSGCLGARAVECAERLTPGAGVLAAGAVFDLQWRPLHARGPSEIVAAAAGGRDADALAACVTEDREVDARLAAHAELARRHGLAAAPGGFVLTTGAPQRVSPFGDWLTEATLRAIVRCLVQERCEEAV